MSIQNIKDLMPVVNKVLSIIETEADNFDQRIQILRTAIEICKLKTCDIGPDIPAMSMADAVDKGLI